MTKVEWHPDTKLDINRLFEFLNEVNPDAAGRFVQTLKHGAGLLTDNPKLGRPMQDDTGRYELFLPFGGGQYVMRYMLSHSGVYIIRVWHSRENR